MLEKSNEFQLSHFACLSLLMVQLQDVLLESSLIGIQVTLKTAWLGNLLAQDNWPVPGIFWCPDSILLYKVNQRMRNYKNIHSGLPLLEVNCWFTHNVIKIQYWRIINPLELLPSRRIRAAKNSFSRKFSPRKGTLFCDTVRLNF